MELQLNQRGRASMDFLVSFGRAAAQAEGKLAADIKQSGVSEDTLADDSDARLAQMEALLAQSHALHMRDLLTEWSAPCERRQLHPCCRSNPVARLQIADNLGSARECLEWSRVKPVKE